MRFFLFAGGRRLREEKKNEICLSPYYLPKDSLSLSSSSIYLSVCLSVCPQMCLLSVNRRNARVKFRWFCATQKMKSLEREREREREREERVFAQSALFFFDARAVVLPNFPAYHQYRFWRETLSLSLVFLTDVKKRCLRLKKASFPIFRVFLFFACGEHAQLRVFARFCFSRKSRERSLK